MEGIMKIFVKTHKSIAKETATIDRHLAAIPQDTAGYEFVIREFNASIQVLKVKLQYALGFIEELEPLTSDDSVDKDALDAAVDQITEVHDEGTKTLERAETLVHQLTEKLQAEMPQPQVPQSPGLENQLSRLLSVYESQQRPERPNNVRVHKIDPPKFDGDLFKFKGYWDLFRSAIDENPDLDNIHKLQYLLASLSGEPLALVSSLNLSEENYPVAVALLQQHYGNTERVITKMRTSLMTMKSVQNTSTALRKFYTEFDTTIRSLRAMGEDVNDRSYVDIVLSKLPPPVVVQVERAKGRHNKWSLELLCDMLFEFDEVLARESADSRKPTTTRDGDDHETAYALAGTENQQASPRPSATGQRGTQPSRASGRQPAVYQQQQVGV
jgi:hypothetical protein